MVFLHRFYPFGTYKSFYPYYLPSYYSNYYPRHYNRYYEPVNHLTQKRGPIFVQNEPKLYVKQKWIILSMVVLLFALAVYISMKK